MPYQIPCLVANFVDTPILKVLESSFLFPPP